VVPDTYEQLKKQDPAFNVTQAVATKFGITFPRGVLTLIQDRFHALWRTVADTSHFDEFLLYFPDLDGKGVRYQGCISIHFGELAGTNLLPEDSPDDAAAVMRRAAHSFQEQCKVDRRERRECAVNHENPQVRSRPVVVQKKDFYKIMQRAPPAKIAKMLLMCQEVGPPLYEMFLENGSLAFRLDWDEVRKQMISFMPDQAALDAFSRHINSAVVLFRVTVFVARSLYTELTTVMSSALGELQRLTNDVRPDKLHRALELLDIRVDVNSISMSDSGDGYTLAITQAQRDRLTEIHARQRRNFHITQEIAMLLYQEVARRMGEHSIEYAEMQMLNNRRMEPLPHPHIPCRTINAPPKIFRTCFLLQVIVDRWEFNRFDGYRVSAEDPESIDALERTADWSRHQKALEQPGGFVAPVNKRRGVAGPASSSASSSGPAPLQAVLDPPCSSDPPW